MSHNRRVDAARLAAEAACARHLASHLDALQPFMPPSAVGRLRTAAAAAGAAAPAPACAPAPRLTAQLRQYQQEGVEWLASMRHNGTSAILADEMVPPLPEPASRSRTASLPPPPPPCAGPPAPAAPAPPTGRSPRRLTPFRPPLSATPGPWQDAADHRAAVVPARQPGGFAGGAAPGGVPALRAALLAERVQKVVPLAACGPPHTSAPSSLPHLPPPAAVPSPSSRHPAPLPPYPPVPSRPPQVRLHTSDKSEAERLYRETLARPSSFDVAVTTYEMAMSDSLELALRTRISWRATRGSRPFPPGFRPAPQGVLTPAGAAPPLPGAQALPGLGRGAPRQERGGCHDGLSEEAAPRVDAAADGDAPAEQLARALGAAQFPAPAGPHLSPPPAFLRCLAFSLPSAPAGLPLLGPIRCCVRPADCAQHGGPGGPEPSALLAAAIHAATRQIRGGRP